MGINVEVTGINTENNSVSFNHGGESKTMSIVLPANIKWVKKGKAEIGINEEGNINFIKSLEPKTSQTGGWNKPESKIMAISTVKVMEDVGLVEFAAVYDNINATQNTKCSASTLFRRDNGKYDAVLYVTTFVPRGLSFSENESII